MRSPCRNSIIYYGIDEVAPPADWFSFNGRFSFTHNGGANLLFFDGHVEYAAASRIPPSPPIYAASPYVWPW